MVPGTTSRHHRPGLKSVCYFVLIVTLLALSAVEAVRQYREQQFVSSLARDVLLEAHATDELSAVIALRDYVRTHVDSEGYDAVNRPPLRDSAADVLRSGKGYCGEATRAFINLASAVGIPARRIYLEGRKPHVPAIVRFADGKELVVDPYYQLYIPENLPLGEVMRRPEFDYYSTLGWRQAPVLRRLPPNALDLGRLGLWLENPHALKAALWFIAALGLLASTRVAPFLRRRFRRVKSPGGGGRAQNVLSAKTDSGW